MKRTAKKIGKVIIGIVLVILLLGVTFFIINKVTGFCIKEPIVKLYYDLMGTVDASEDPSPDVALAHIRKNTDDRSAIIILNNNLCITTQAVLDEMKKYSDDIASQDKYEFFIVGKDKSLADSYKGDIKRLDVMFDEGNALSKEFETYDISIDNTFNTVLVLDKELKVEENFVFAGEFSAYALLYTLGILAD